MSDRVLGWLIFWGIWLLIPVILDGINATAQFLVVGGDGLRRSFRRRVAPDPDWWPFLSVIVPVRNGEVGLPRSLDALLAQRYPGPLEIIIIDNASTDRTREISYAAAAAATFPVHVVALDRSGKTRALNAGIALARGELIVHIDADTAVFPGALAAVARAFVDDPRLGAATGSVEIRPPDAGMPLGLRILAYCEFLEYLSSFRIGRQYQAATNSLYTLSGAFSCFRRSALLSTFLYSSDTVSEDTMLTFDFHYGRAAARGQGGRKHPWRLGFIPDARASLDPIPSIGALYAQRARWQRGQLEVNAAHADKLYRGLLRPRAMAPARTLLADHTLLFPRLVWTALLPVLIAFGYSVPLVLTGVLGMYIFYLIGDTLSIGVSYGLSDKRIRRRIAADFVWLPLLPLYRYLVSLCRLGGILESCAEPPTWRSRDPGSQIRDRAREVRALVARHARLVGWNLGRGGRVEPPDSTQSAPSRTGLLH